MSSLLNEFGNSKFQSCSVLSTKLTWNWLHFSVLAIEHFEKQMLKPTELRKSNDLNSTSENSRSRTVIRSQKYFFFVSDLNVSFLSYEHRASHFKISFFFEKHVSLVNILDPFASKLQYYNWFKMWFTFLMHFFFEVLTASLLNWLVACPLNHVPLRLLQ
jgi:hypothetical protein